MTINFHQDTQQSRVRGEAAAEHAAKVNRLQINSAAQVPMISFLLYATNTNTKY